MKIRANGILLQVSNITNKIQCTVEKDLLMLKSDMSSQWTKIHICNATFHTTNQHAKGTVIIFYDTGQ